MHYLYFSFHLIPSLILLVFLYLDLDPEVSGSLSRSKTMPTLSRPKLTKKLAHVDGNAERLRHAKEVAEKAMKVCIYIHSTCMWSKLVWLVYGV